MKHLAALFTLIIILFSCQKDEINPNPPAELIGNWEWLYTYMGWAPGPSNPLTPANTGNTEMIRFGDDYSWIRYINDLPSDSGTFTMGHGVYSPSDKIRYSFDSIQYYKNGEMVRGMVDYFEIHNDTLISCTAFKGIYGSSSKTYKKR